MHRSIEQWAADAADHVQYACNLSGLVFSFEQCVTDLAEEAKRLGENTDWINRHPICVLWADKLDDLSRSRDLDQLNTDDPLTILVPKFAAVMREVCNEAASLGHGTDWRNQHPKVQDFVRKLVSVTGSREGLAVFNAFDSCEKLARREAIKTGE
jgi:hypothetical protein